jgi:hypothetical protein
VLYCYYVTTLGELQEQVSARYEHIQLPVWSNPHPEMAAPREDEYSRLSEPERYRIVYARARLWADLLSDLPGNTVETLAPAPLDDDSRMGRFDRGVQLTSPRPDTLPLLLERDVRSDTLEPPLAVLHISVVRPRIAIAMLPTCGCDACDHGSDDLLEAIDETIGNVIGGPFVALRGPGWHAQWHPHGSSAGGTGHHPDLSAMTDLCRRLADGQDVRLPKGAQAYVGRPWFG